MHHIGTSERTKDYHAPNLTSRTCPFEFDLNLSTSLSLTSMISFSLSYQPDPRASRSVPSGSQHAIRLGDAARLRRHPGEHALAQRQPHHHHLSPGGDSDESPATKRREPFGLCHREAAAARHVHPLAREEEDRRPANQEAVPVRPVPRGAPHREASRRAQPAGPRAAEQLEPAQADRLPRRPAPA